MRTEVGHFCTLVVETRRTNQSQSTVTVITTTMRKKVTLNQVLSLEVSQMVADPRLKVLMFKLAAKILREWTGMKWKSKRLQKRINNVCRT